MPLLTTELALEIDEAFADDLACEMAIHQWAHHSGAAIVYGIQVAVKRCGCPGIVLPSCGRCQSFTLSYRGDYRCVRCSGIDGNSFIRWEPIR